MRFSAVLTLIALALATPSFAQTPGPACLGPATGFVKARFRDPGGNPATSIDLTDKLMNVLQTQTPTPNGEAEFHNLGPGDYLLRATFGAANEVSWYYQPIQLKAQELEIVIVPTITHACYATGACSPGSISLYAPQDPGTFAYAWSNGATTRDVTGLAPGNYSVTVTTPQGCTRTLGYSIVSRGLDSVAPPLAGRGLPGSPLVLAPGNSAGEVLQWNGTAWVSAPAPGGGGTTLPAPGSVVLTQSGNVGIGVAQAGNARLLVRSSGPGANAFQVRGSQGQGSLFRIAENQNGHGVMVLEDNAGAPAVRFNAGNGPSFINAGNLGIGTETPAAKLHVGGGSQFDGPVTMTGIVQHVPPPGGGGAGVVVVNPGGGLEFLPGAPCPRDQQGHPYWALGGNNMNAPPIGGDDCRLGTNNATGLGIETNDQQRMLFRADGNIIAFSPVAFGTPLPNPAFGQHRAVVNNHFTGAGAVPLAETALRVTVPVSPANPNSAAFAVTGAANSYPNTAGEERFVVTNAGNVGVGVATPLQPLHVEGASFLNGNVGVGVAVPGYPLQVEGRSFLKGNVGIGCVPHPDFRLRVVGEASFGEADGTGRICVGSLQSTTTSVYELWNTGFVGFNASRNPTAQQWVLHSDGQHNGGAFITANTTGEMRFISIGWDNNNPGANRIVSDGDFNSGTGLAAMSILPGGGGVEVSNTLVVDAIGNAQGRGNTLRFGGWESGTFIGSNRVAGHSNLRGLDFYTNSGDATLPGYTPFPRMSITESGNVIIGNGTTAAPQNVRLQVNGDTQIEGSICVRAFYVRPNGGSSCWPDYVFSDSYSLPSLSEVREYIGQNRRLPGVPSEDQVHTQGYEQHEMNTILLRKIEELQLYILQLEQRLNIEGR